MYTDATCYESEMRYPTGQKLLWESNEKAYTVMCEASGRLGIHRPRTKYLDVARANMGYTKQRKHSRSQTSSIVRRLLQLLGKILKEIRKMERAYAGKDVLTDKESHRPQLRHRAKQRRTPHRPAENPHRKPLRGGRHLAGGSGTKQTIISGGLKKGV